MSTENHTKRVIIGITGTDEEASGHTKAYCGGSVMVMTIDLAELSVARIRMLRQHAWLCNIIVEKQNERQNGER